MQALFDKIVAKGCLFLTLETGENGLRYHGHNRLIGLETSQFFDNVICVHVHFLSLL